MKIAISAEGKNLDRILDSRFGRCEYFQIYNQEGSQLKVVENKGITAEGGAGIAAAQQIIDEEVDVVITGSLGPNAYNIIDKAKIKAFTCDNIAMEAVLKAFKNNELQEITYAGPAHRGMSK